MLWLVDYVWERILARGVATETWVLAQAFATEAWVTAKGYATEAWVLAKGYLTISYVDRGFAGSWDFTLGDFTADSAWHDLNLSAIVPAGAKGVLVHTWIKSSSINQQLRLRKKGTGAYYTAQVIHTQIANIGFLTEIIIGCDTNRKVEYYLYTPPWTYVNLAIRGWWL